MAVLLPTVAALLSTLHRYERLHAVSVLRTQWATEGVLFLFGAGLAGGLIRSSLSIAHRTRPFFVPLTAEDLAMEGYRSAFERYRRGLWAVVPAVFGLFAGATAAGQWQTAQLWWHRTTFGVTDTYFGRDAGFFVFTVPWLRFLVSLLTMCLALALLAAVVAHALHGGLSVRGIPSEDGRLSTRAARLHLAVLMAALMLVRAASFWVARYEAVSAPGPKFAGISSSTERAWLPAHAVMAVLAACSAMLFLSVLRTDSMRLPLIGAGVVVIVGVLGGQLAPALYQRFTVGPHAERFEPVYARQAETATTEAFDLDGLSTRTLPRSSGGVDRATQKAIGAAVPDPISAKGTAGGGGSAASTSDDSDARARRAADRVADVAPWLAVDGHPYRVTSRGTAVWVVDGYTTTASYPGAERYQLGGEAGTRSSTDVRGGVAGLDVNYVRDAVKAVVDDRSDRVWLYAADPKEPILRAWEGVFPGTVRPLADMDPVVRRSLRYPSDLFAAQRDVLTKYHPQSVDSFLRSVPWSASGGAGSGPRGAGEVARTTISAPGSSRGEPSLSAAFGTGGRHARFAGLLTVPDRATAATPTLWTPASGAPATPDPDSWVASLAGSMQRSVSSSTTLAETVRRAWHRGTVTFEPVQVVPSAQGAVFVETITTTRQVKDAHPDVVAVVVRSGDRTAWDASLAKALTGLTPTAAERKQGQHRGSVDAAQRALDDLNTARGKGDTSGEAAAAKRLQGALDALRKVAG